MSTSYLLSHSAALVAGLAIFLVLYKAAVYIRRLYFHPLSKFPGPQICAASRLYEFYWDSYKNGRLWSRLPELHDKYGPIIRIGPDELHIRDSEFFTYLFAFKPLDKWAISGKEYGLTYAMFGTEEYKQYTQRRAAFGDAFSKSKALKLQPLVNEKINVACDKIREKAGSVDLAFLYRAITAEILTVYMYGQQYGYFDDERTTKGLYDRRFDSLFGFTHLGRFIPFWMPLLLIMLRGRLSELLGSKEPSSSILGFMKFAEKMLQKVVDEHGVKVDTSTEKNYKTAAEVYLHSALPEQDKTGQALVQATMAAWSGGWDTTSFALTQASYYLLRRPEVMCKLQEELRTAWPDPTEDADMSKLGQLPYLDAIIKETLRLMYGVLTRLTRMSPTSPEQYQSWTIPAGTKISMSLPDVNLDTSIWGPDVHDFRPERWLDHPGLNKWLMTFSRGTRVCAGEELAWVELKMIVATLWRKFELEFDPKQNVTDDDIVPYCDGHTPGAKNMMQRLPVIARVAAA